ncbi:MAG: hypothetical protein AAF997_24300, partial [Myxococcota bacterium]
TPSVPLQLTLPSFRRAIGGAGVVRDPRRRSGYRTLVVGFLDSASRFLKVPSDHRRAPPLRLPRGLAR